MERTAEGVIRSQSSLQEREELWDMEFGSEPLGIDRDWQAMGEMFKVPSSSLPISDGMFKLFKKMEHFQCLLLYIQDLFQKVEKKLQ